MHSRRYACTHRNILQISHILPRKNIRKYIYHIKKNTSLRIILEPKVTNHLTLTDSNSPSSPSSRECGSHIIPQLWSWCPLPLATQWCRQKNKTSFYILGPYDDESLSTLLDLELRRRPICGHVFKDASQRIKLRENLVWMWIAPFLGWDSKPMKMRKWANHHSPSLSDTWLQRQCDPPPYTPATSLTIMDCTLKLWAQNLPLSLNCFCHVSRQKKEK